MRPRPVSHSISHSGYESDVGESSTVWSQHPIASYLNRDDTNESVHSVSTSNSPEAVSEEEGEQEASDTSGTEGLLEDDIEIDGVSPSLGYLESALGFLAAEKAKLTLSAASDSRNTSHSSTGDSAWRHVIEPKRKRRRKRKGTLSRTLEQEEEIPPGARTATVVPSPEASSSEPDLSSSPDKHSHSPPAQSSSMSRHIKARLPSQSQPQSQQRLYMASSAPIPIPRSLPTSPDPRLLRLRALAKKLRHDFPQNDSRLARVLVEDFSGTDFIDPRGPDPQMGDALTHVFIDQCVVYLEDICHASCVL